MPVSCLDIVEIRQQTGGHERSRSLSPAARYAVEEAEAADRAAAEAEAWLPPKEEGELPSGAEERARTRANLDEGVKCAMQGST